MDSPFPSRRRIDEWTAETDPRVVAARAGGERVTCLANDVLERSTVPVVGVTGTAGKTTTTALVIAMLRATGRPVACGTTARAGNLWPDEALLVRVATLEPPAIVVVELTSTHLCYMDTSPSVAVVTNLWPDHGELHGSHAAYLAAKRRIVRFQEADGLALLPRAYPEAAAFAASTIARCVLFEGAPAVAAGRALGVPDGVIASVMARGVDLPHRFRNLGMVAGLDVIDDGMAATPRKVLLAVDRLVSRRVVWIGGGHAEDVVHDDPAERAALEEACARIRAAGWAAVLYGSAGRRLHPLVGGERVDTLADAIAVAIEQGREGDVLLHAPMFPATMADREAFVAATGGRTPGPCSATG